MRCKICNRDIASDSTYCSYCGNRVDRPTDHSGPQDNCVRPHMPKKKCAECGKELPGSSISDICAMCTIRRRNREIEAQRDREDLEGSSRRDRYDISDEFDQSVFARTSYYREPASTEQLEKKLSAKRIGCIVALAIFLLLGGLIFAAARFGYKMVESSVSVNMSGASDGGKASSREARGLSRESFIKYHIYPIATEQLSYYLGEVTSLGPDKRSIHADGGFIYLSGKADYYSLDEDGERDIFYTEPYELCVMLSEDGYMPLYLNVGDVEFYDNRSLVDTEGYLTEEGAEVFDREVGELVFTTPVLYLEEFQ